MTHLYIAMKIVMIIFCLFPIIYYIQANIEAILFTEIENIITFHKTHELYVNYICIVSLWWAFKTYNTSR